MENKAKLYAKITNLAKEIGAMKEDGKNDFDHYKFISYQNVNARLRSLLPKYNLAIVPSVTNYEERDYTTSKGSQSILFIVFMSVLFVDPETGYSEERTFVGGDQDTKGKSLGQAITECQKRFEMKLFHVSSTEPDPDSSSNEVNAVKPTTTKKKEYTTEEKKKIFLNEVSKLEKISINAGQNFDDILKNCGYDTRKDIDDVIEIQYRSTLDLINNEINKKGKAK